MSEALFGQDWFYTDRCDRIIISGVPLAVLSESVMAVVFSDGASVPLERIIPYPIF